ncbi:MAG TPA: hypothetical protein VKF42_08215 [Chitinivibrionales bacterium]|nr:hypothetical protein [Chitinivibrionales bacterium]
MADDLKRFMEAEICMMKRDIGYCRDTSSEYFTRKAIEWIEKNSAGFRAEWDRKKRKAAAGKCGVRRKAVVYDVE